MRAPERLPVAAEVGGETIQASMRSGMFISPLAFPSASRTTSDPMMLVHNRVCGGPSRRRPPMAMLVTLEIERLLHRRLPSSETRLHADDAQVADEHLEFAVAVQVAQLHVGDAAVGFFQGVFRIAGDDVPDRHPARGSVAAWRETPRSQPLAVGADGRAQAADELALGQIQLVPGR